MKTTDQCAKEIQEVLNKYGCTLKVGAVLQTEGISFKVDVVYAKGNGAKTETRSEEKGS